MELLPGRENGPSKSSPQVTMELQNVPTGAAFLRACVAGVSSLLPVCVYDMKKERPRIARSFVLPLKMPNTPTPFLLLQQTAIADLTPSKFFTTSTRLRFEKKKKKRERERERD